MGPEEVDQSFSTSYSLGESDVFFSVVDSVGWDEIFGSTFPFDPPT